MTACKRVLIVRLSAVGDTVLTLPLAQCIREARPDFWIGWLVGEAAAPVLKGVDSIDRVHIVPKRVGPSSFRALLASLRAEHYSYSLDPQGITRSALWPWLAGIPERIGFPPGPLETRELAPWLLNRQVPVADEITRISERTLSLVASFGIASVPVPRVHYRVDANAAAIVDSWWRQQGLGSRVLVVGIGAGWPTKVWPPERVRLVMESAYFYGLRSVVIWGPTEKLFLPNWKHLFGNLGVLIPSWGIAEMIALIDRCYAYAGPDSAGLHIAAMLGKPTFSWFGASDPARCAPTGTLHAHVAQGPHHWKRGNWAGNPLSQLKTEKVLLSFNHWLEERIA